MLQNNFTTWPIFYDFETFFLKLGRKSILAKNFIAMNNFELKFFMNFGVFEELMLLVDPTMVEKNKLNIKEIKTVFVVFRWAIQW